MKDLFFELIRVGLDLSKTINKVSSHEEWMELYEISREHTLTGVLINAVQILYQDSRYSSSIEKSLYLKLIGIESVIKEENQRVNKRCVKLINYFQEQGFNSSILKGQGIAALYRNGEIDLRLLRRSGDIDLWIGGGREKVLRQLNTLFEELDCDYKHAHAPFFSDTEVEVHWIQEKLMKL